MNADVLLRAVLEVSGEALCVSDASGVVIAVNAAFAALLDAASQQIAGRSLTQLLVADSAPGVALVHPQAGTLYRAAAGEARLRCERASELRLEQETLRVSVFREERRVAERATNEDVHAEPFAHAQRVRQRELDRELRAAGERLRQIIAGSHDAYVAMSQDGLIQDWSVQAEQVFGWPRAEVIGRRLSEVIIPPPHRAAHERGMRHFLATGAGPVLNRMIEVEGLHRTGHAIPLELTVLPVEQEGGYLFSAFIRDISVRKRLEDSLRVALSERETILDAAVVGIAHVVERCVRWINPVFEQSMLGYAKDELVGSDFERIYAAHADYVRLGAEYPAVLAAAQTFRCEVELRRKDGATFWARMLGRAVDPKDLARGSICIVEDVTEERARARDLAARNARLELHRRVLLELAALNEDTLNAALTHILRACAQTLEVERAAYWPFAPPPAALPGPLLYLRSSGSVTHEGVNLPVGEHTRARPLMGLLKGQPIISNDTLRDPLFADVVDTVLKPRDIHALMAVPVWAGGRIVGALTFAHVAAPRAWGDDEVEFAFSVARTVSLSLEAEQRRELMEALRSSEAKYRHVVENASEPIVVLAQGRFRFANRRALALAGNISLEAFLALPFLEFFHPDERERVLSNHKRRVQGMPAETNYVVRMGDKVPGVDWAQINATQIEWDGEPAALVIFNDLTAQMRVEAEMRKALEKERELSELKTRFVSMTSHEFRTPLATILSSTQLLEDYAERLAPPERAELLGFIKQSVHRMTEMLDDVLLIGRADAGRLEFNPQPVDLSQLCTSVVDSVRMGIGAQHVIELNQPERTPSVRVDVKLMRHVLNNLLSNAIKYSPPASRVELNLKLDATQICLEVLDQGIGIAEEDLAHLFDLFHRGANVGTISGTGLGLSIVKRAVDMHGGSIRLSARPPRGTRCVVALPLRT